MRHDRTLSQDQLVRRAEAETRPCPPAPRGCGATIGQRCRHLRTGLPLGRQLAHGARLFPQTTPPSAPVDVPEQRVPDARELAAASHR